MNNNLKHTISIITAITIASSLSFTNYSTAHAYEEKHYNVSINDSFRDTINPSSLNPVKTGVQKVDDYVDEVLKQITTSNMNTCEKVKACYDYLVKNINYGYINEFPDGINRDFISRYDSSIVTNGIQTLYSKTGMDEGISSAFVLLTRAIGLDSYVVNGKVNANNSAWTNHMWVVININGEYYVFDPSLEKSFKSDNKINYYCFCRAHYNYYDEESYSIGDASSNSLKKSASDVFDDYYYTDMNSDISSFKNFQKQNGWVKSQDCEFYNNYLNDKHSNDWYYYENGEKKKGWLELDSKKYYLSPSTYLMATGLCKIDSKYYQFDDNGVLISEVSKNSLGAGTELHDLDSNGSEYICE